ncbi:CapA family protein [Bacillus shivajii]|uniref:CapA family protein n=1 Tax=Bacillus shivajii TaxID=1983719 RepID=UPI001CF9C02C|nr:CapA family protein [Bacillus shivajii]UCZ52991.1 CapA family protein [Bacillus shivajii]
MKRQLSFEENILKWSKKHKKKLTLHTSAFAIVAAVLLMTSNLWTHTAIPHVEKDEEAVLTATFVGDMMFGRHVRDVINHRGYDYLFTYTDPYFEVSDFATGSFKHPVLIKERDPIDKSIIFSTTPESVDVLRERNFRSVSIANNNIYDYGYLAFLDTIDFFEEKEGIQAAGAMVDLEDIDNAVYTEQNGLTIATLAMTDIAAANSIATTFRPGIMPLDPPRYAIHAITNASKEADLVVVHTHWGEPYDSHVSSRQQELAHAMSHAGADIIIGHYPHVLSPVEIYNDTIIFYSLGNFIFDQGWTRTKQTALAQYHLYENGEAEVELVPFVIQEGQPRPVTNFSYRKASIHRMLTKFLNKDQWETDGNSIKFRVNHERLFNRPEQASEEERL